jgi:hypothetical protein
LAGQVLLKIVYLLICRIPGLIVVLARGDRAAAAEVLVLRHQNAVLRRHAGRMRYEPADRAWFSALAARTSMPPTAPSGKSRGLSSTLAGHHVTHVLLQEGHLWGRKEVAIPITAVTAVGVDGVQLSTTKQQVQDLPPVHIDHPSR